MSERKYRQSGYMDDEPHEKRQRRTGPRERSEKPRGRGLGAPTKTVFKCSRCGQSTSLAQAMAYDATCSGCGSDLHTCTNCSQFDSSAPNECRKPIPAPVMKKAKRNDCDLFEPKVTQEFDTDKPSPDDARAAFDSLFDI